MTSIVHISDTHFGTEIPAVLNALKQCIQTLYPDIVILTGDITQRARGPQFKAAAEFLNSLQGKTKLVIPGNHDIPLFNVFARFLIPYRNYKKWFGAQEHHWCNGEIGVVCYDATSPYRHTRGMLKRQQVLRNLNAIKSRLAGKSITIACAHQPLLVARTEDTDETLVNREETASLWSENQVDLVLSGHVHVPLFTTTKNQFPELNRHFILAGAGTAVSHRTRPGAPNSFNVITIMKNENEASISIALYTYETESSQFRPATAIRFLLGDRGWYEAV